MRRSLNIWLAAAILAASLSAADGAAASGQRFFPKKDLMRIGIYYYPEQWPQDQWARDLQNMARLGFEFTHFAEFAWTFLEPGEGRYDFAWLDEAIRLAAEAKLKVILCTPTPCPPAWMGEKHPEIYLVRPDGRRLEHGTRANVSLSDDFYLEACRRIVAAMAERYGKDARIWGWQLDNEPGAFPDHSSAARRKFQEWLARRYATIDRLNEAWGGNFWSYRYGSFSQVLIPNTTLFNEDEVSPHAVLDFKRFTADNQAAFLHGQYEILRQRIRPEQWVTTNFVNVVTDADPRRSGRLDFISFTIYPVRGQNLLGGNSFRIGDPFRMAAACDYFRPIRGATGVMELQPGQVNWARTNPQPEPGAVRMWLWHAFAGGCSFACTYRYRSPLVGGELYHDGIVGPDGVTLSRGGGEFFRTLAEMKRLRTLYDPKARLPVRLAEKRAAILWSHDVLWDIENHKQTELWDTWRHRTTYLSALKSTGAPLDFVAEKDDFSPYAVLVAPAYQLVDRELVEKWRAYVERGGHLVLTCRTGQKDKNGRLPEMKWAGMIAPLIGAGVRFYDVLLAEGRGKVEAAGNVHAWNVWADVLAPEAKTEVLARYADQFYSGQATAVRRTLGKGSVTYIGVETLDGRLERGLVRDVFKRAGLAIEDYPVGVYVEWRDGFFIAVNYTDSPYAVPLSPSAEVLIGKNPLAPAEVLIWRER